MPKVKLADGSTVWATVAGARVLAERVEQSPDAAPERPTDNASRAAWDAYARHIGLDPAGFPSKRALIAAIGGGG